MCIKDLPLGQDPDMQVIYSAAQFFLDQSSGDKCTAKEKLHNDILGFHEDGNVKENVENIVSHAINFLVRSGYYEKANR